MFPGFGFYVHNAWEFYNFGRDLHNFVCNFWTSWWMIHVPSYIFTIMFWGKKPPGNTTLFLNTQPLNFIHWTFPDFMSLASLFCIKSQVVKVLYLNLLPTFCKDWTLAVIPRQHSFRHFKLNLQHARLVCSSCCWMYILCIEKSFYFPQKKIHLRHDQFGWRILLNVYLATIGYNLR